MKTDTEQFEIARFLVRSAAEFREGGWVFTGFNWPILAARVARKVYGNSFVQVFETGAACDSRLPRLPTSATDYDAYYGSECYAASTVDVLFGFGRRLSRVILDASNVDLTGCVNSTAIGDYLRPTVRLPGGGGAPDIAALTSRSLVLLNGGRDLSRIQTHVEHITIGPSRAQEVRLITRYGVVELGQTPRLCEILSSEGAARFIDDLAAKGVEVENAVQVGEPPERLVRAAMDTLVEAASRGYRFGRRAGTDMPHDATSILADPRPNTTAEAATQ